MDKRELILTRIETVLSTVPGIVSVYRNRSEAADKRRPAVILLDADERGDDRTGGSRRPTYAPHIVHLTPEIFVLLAGPPENRQLGTELNVFRAQILNKLLLDEDLVALVGSNGEIRYNGCVTDLATDRSMQGEMALGITFTYVLDPRQLVEQQQGA